MPAARSGKSRLIRPGISTFSRAMEVPTTAHSVSSTGGAIRSTMPPQSATSAAHSAASVPQRRASFGATIEPRPMKISGMVVTRLLAVAVSWKCRPISLSNGETPASAARILSAARTIPAMTRVCVYKRQGLGPAIRAYLAKSGVRSGWRSVFREERKESKEKDREGRGRPEKGRRGRDRRGQEGGQERTGEAGRGTKSNGETGGGN